MKTKLGKAVLLFLVSMLAFNYCGGGSTGGVDGPDIYAAGNCKNSSNRYVAGYWKNGKWTSLGNTYGDYDAEVLSFVMDGNDITAGGYCKKNTVAVAGVWKTSGGVTSWIEFVNSYGNYDACVMTITVYNSTIYAGGYCVDSGGNYLAGYWMTTAGGTTTWTPLSDAALSFAAYVKGITVSNTGDVYAGGYYFKSKGIPCFWKNNASGRTEFENKYDLSYGAFADTVVIDGSDIYTGGYCISTSNPTTGEMTTVAGYWKMAIGGTVYTWTPLTHAGSGPYAEIMTIKINGTDVYAGGYSTDAGNVTIAGYWKNSTWQECKNSYSSDEAYVEDLFIYGSDVYAAGYCKNGGYYSGGYWMNGKWNELANSYGSYESTVKTIIIK